MKRPAAIPTSCEHIDSILSALKQIETPDNKERADYIRKELGVIRDINAELRAFGSEQYLKVQELTKKK